MAPTASFVGSHCRLQDLVVHNSQQQQWKERWVHTNTGFSVSNGLVSGALLPVTSGTTIDYLKYTPLSLTAQVPETCVHPHIKRYGRKTLGVSYRARTRESHLFHLKIRHACQQAVTSSLMLGTDTLQLKENHRKQRNNNVLMVQSTPLAWRWTSLKSAQRNAPQGSEGLCSPRSKYIVMMGYVAWNNARWQRNNVKSGSYLPLTLRQHPVTRLSTALHFSSST